MKRILFDDSQLRVHIALATYTYTADSLCGLMQVPVRSLFWLAGARDAPFDVIACKECLRIEAQEGTRHGSKEEKEEHSDSERPEGEGPRDPEAA